MKNKMIIAVLFSVLLASITSFAEMNVNYNRESGKVNVSVSGVSNGDTVSMIVLKKGADYDKFVNGDAGFGFDVVGVHIADANSTGDQVSFAEFVMPDSLEMGDYKIVVMSPDGIEQDFINHATITQTLALWNNADLTGDEAIELVNKYNDVYSFEITNGDYILLDDDAKKDMLLRLKGELYLTPDAIEAAFDTKLATYIVQYKLAAFNSISGQSDASIIEENCNKYEKIFNLDNKNDSLFSKLSSEDKLKVYAKMTNESYSTDVEVQKAFKKKVILRYLEIGPYGKSAEYLNDYEDELEITLPNSIATANLKALVGANMKNTDDLMEILTGEQNDTSSGTQGSSPLGGGGGAGRGFVKTEPPVSSQNTQQPEDKNVSFLDVPKSHWAYENIKFLYGKNIVLGDGNGKFEPESDVTRAEALKMIVLALGYKTPARNTISFLDVTKDDWFYPYVSIAVNENITTGYGNGSFGAEDKITREDLCTMLYRAGKKTLTGGNANFSDKNEISDYAIISVEAFAKLGIVNGMEDGTFKPKANATKAQLAAILCRYCYSMK